MIDSHCHLDHEPIFSNLKEIIERSKNEGVKKLLTICTTLEPWLKIINPPNKANTNIMGNNQNFFLTFKKFQNSIKKLIILKLIF